MRAGRIVPVPNSHTGKPYKSQGFGSNTQRDLALVIGKS